MVLCRKWWSLAESWVWVHGFGRVPMYSTASVRLPCQASWYGSGLLFLHPQYSSVQIFVWKAPENYFHCILGVNVWILHWPKEDLNHCWREKSDFLNSGYLRHILYMQSPLTTWDWGNKFSCSASLFGLCSRSKISPYTNTGSWLKVLQCYSTKFFLLWQSLLNWGDCLVITL